MGGQNPLYIGPNSIKADSGLCPMSNSNIKRSLFFLLNAVKRLAFNLLSTTNPQ